MMRPPNGAVPNNNFRLGQEGGQRVATVPPEQDFSQIGVPTAPRAMFIEGQPNSFVNFMRSLRKW